MDSHCQKMICIALILAIAMPISTAYWRRIPTPRSNDPEQNLRDLCSQTDKPDVCWSFLKPQLQRFHNSDDRDIADGVIDLTISKAKEIQDNLNHWFTDSYNDNSKVKYHACSKNYDDVARNLEEARRDLDSDVHRRVSNEIGDAEQELEKCKREFRVDSFDPTHVGDRNNELGLYLNMARVAVDRLGDYYDDGDRNNNKH